MSRVFVVDAARRPLMPTRPARARLLLKQGKAAILRRFPLVLILKTSQPDAKREPLRVKLDPGATTSGIAVVNDTTGEVVWAAELTHRGQAIRKALTARRAVRRRRRQRKTRYRPKRFTNRCRPAGWLAPSLCSCVLNLLTWVTRLSRWCPVGALSQELTKFDTQALQDPAIAGIQYQQGTLAGWAYLLEKWKRQCAYCQQPAAHLQVEHLIPKSRGGSDRPSNLVLACEVCNQRKGHQTAEEFGFSHLMAQAKVRLSGAAVMNATRWALYRALLQTGLPLEVSTGGRTSYNRATRRLPKTHWIDAAVIGASTPARVEIQGVHPWLIQATGWQRRQMCLMDAAGFPRTRAKQRSRVKGFRTGDLVRAVVNRGSKVGNYGGTGRSKGKRVVQYHHGPGDHARHQRPLVSSASAERRLSVYERGSGVSSRPLKRGRCPRRNFYEGPNLLDR